MSILKRKKNPDRVNAVVHAGDWGYLQFPNRAAFNKFLSHCGSGAPLDRRLHEFQGQDGSTVWVRPSAVNLVRLKRG